MTIVGSAKPMRRIGCHSATRMATPVPMAIVTWSTAASVQADPRRRRTPRDAKAAMMAKTSVPPATNWIADRRRAVTEGVLYAPSEHAEEDRNGQHGGGLEEEQAAQHAQHRSP